MIYQYYITVHVIFTIISISSFHSSLQHVKLQWTWHIRAIFPFISAQTLLNKPLSLAEHTFPNEAMLGDFQFTHSYTIMAQQECCVMALEPHRWPEVAHTVDIIWLSNDQLWHVLDSCGFGTIFSIYTQSKDDGFGVAKPNTNPEIRSSRAHF